MKRLYSYLSDQELTAMYDKRTTFPFWRFVLALLTFKAMYHVSILLFIIMLVVSLLWIFIGAINSFNVTNAIKEELEYRKVKGDDED